MYKLIKVLLVTSFFVGCASCKKHNEPVVVSPIDYSNMDYWYAYENQGKEADVFYVYPTVSTISYEENDNSWLTDITLPEVRREANSNQRFNKLLYNDYNFFAPYYRQMIFDVYQQESDTIKKASAQAAADVKAAFDYYMEHFNQGRPFFLVAHSQGSQMFVKLLEDGMTDAQRSLMVAAYCIGWTIPQEELDAYADKLIPATDSCGTGCVIIFNSVTNIEAVAPMFANTVVGINPLSWSTDTTFVPKEAHLGMARYNDSRDSIIFIPEVSGGQLQHQMMVCPEVDPDICYVAAYEAMFPYGNLHFADSWLFGGNVKQNMACRLRHFQK